MAGEVTASSAILQSRLTSPNRPNDTRWTGLLGALGVARFEFSVDPKIQNAGPTSWLEAKQENDFIVKAAVSGLQPGARYYYRLAYGPSKDNLRRSPIQTFRTHSTAEKRDEFLLAVVSCMNYSFFHYSGSGGTPPYSGPDKHLGYPALEAIRKLRPDYFIGTGDNVYYDHPGNMRLLAGRAETQHQMRMKYQEQFSQPRFIELFRETATYWMKDDHDYRFNDSDPVNLYCLPGKVPVSADSYPKTNLWPTISDSGEAPGHDLGIRMFREQLPVVDLNVPDAETFRTHRVSRDLQIWFVEGRDYRSPNDMKDGPQKSIWGKRQKEWLKRTLLESDATFKTLFSPTPLIGPDSRGKRDNHTNPKGFRWEGEEFLRWLSANGFTGRNFCVVNGDRHWQYHSVHPTGIEEFGVGTLVRENAVAGAFPGRPDSTDPEGKIKQPYHSKKVTGGFMTLRAQPGQIEFRFYDDFGVELYAHQKRLH